MASSSAHEQQEQLPNMFKATSAPPPTPSAQPNNHHLATAVAADALSQLLNRLPPTLSLPTRRSSSSTSLPIISLSDSNSEDLLLSAASQLGFFQLTDHGIPSQLANSAELESFSLFELDKDKKESCFPKSWPLDFDDDDEDGTGESFWLDAVCSAESSSSELCLASLRELTGALEKSGLNVIEMLSQTLGFDSPLKENQTRLRSLLCIHKGSNGEKPVMSNGFYPFIIGLQYQMQRQKYSLLSDSGWVTVLPEAESIMVTIGDIAQVWSNGKLKKVRGRPFPCNEHVKNSHSLSLSLLITLPLEKTVSPLLPNLVVDKEHDNEVENGAPQEQNNGNNGVNKKEDRTLPLFRSFSLKDYAWRVFHEPLLFKDPLDKYRN